MCVFFAHQNTNVSFSKKENQRQKWVVFIAGQTQKGYFWFWLNNQSSSVWIYFSLTNANIFFHTLSCIHLWLPPDVNWSNQWLEPCRDQSVIAVRKGGKISVESAVTNVHFSFSKLLPAWDNFPFFTILSWRAYAPPGGSKCIGLTRVQKQTSPQGFSAVYSEVLSQKIDSSPVWSQGLFDCKHQM